MPRQPSPSKLTDAPESKRPTTSRSSIFTCANGMQFDEANGLERGSSFLPKLLTPFPVWHRVHLGVLTPGSPHLKQNTFNTSDSHALNGCPTVPQFQHVHSLLRLIPDKAHRSSDDLYTLGQSRKTATLVAI
ncbi:uncharacterized protein [Drosophila suzukii]|uniref:Uncharacterized protein isoform X5 n=1 Tax=Drosophila suzukii TaxID=28584 RepID=A0ABM4TRT6_DROSZ